MLKKNKVIKRKYQQNIFLTATQSNCLVVIPTGLGKTIIALLLSVYRLKDPDSAIIFLAPTRPLVEQHYRTFLELTTIPEERLVLLTGTTVPEKRKQIYESGFRVLFCTPQVLQNDIISNRIKLKNITLMIFDEAHRATGNYAYTFIAKKYINESANPKILALTASPGKNKQAILEVMNNLFLDDIEIRTQDDPDVIPYIHKVSIKWIDVELPDEMKEIVQQLDILKREYIRQLKEADLLESSNLKNVTRRDLLTAGQLLDEYIRKSQSGYSPFEISFLLQLKKVLANAIRISHMQEVLETQGIESLHKFIQTSLKKIREQQGGKSLIELFQSIPMRRIVENVNKLVEGRINHPKIALLMDLLSKQFEQNPESRVLVFCQFRDTIKVLLEYLEKHELIRPAQFIGQQKRGKEKGLTQKQQLLLLERFKNGEINTLLATSVAEEGLDIAECDVVIFYDVVPSEIRSIQRRGRTGRKKEGTVYILKTKGTREESYFYAERYREKEMKRILKELKREFLAARNKRIREKRSGGHVSDNTDKKNASRTKRKNAESGKGLLNFIQKDPPANGDSNDSYEYMAVMGKQEDLEDNNQNFTDMADSETGNSDEGSGNGSKDAEQEVIDIFMTPADGKSPFIIADTRETSSSVIRELSERNAYVELRKIPVGDYVISKRCGIERKSLSDFTQSLLDGRLFNELIRLREQFPIPVLIIEGNIDSIINIKREAVLGAISSIILNLKVFIYQTSSAKSTADVLIALAKKEQKAPGTNHSIRFKKSPDNMRESMELLLSTIPGINLSRAVDLLNHFGSIKAIFNATEEELMQVRNIGRKLARTIREIGEKRY